MNKLICDVLVILAVSGCSEPAEKIHSVSDYLADAAMRADQIAKCRDNPGEFAATANCRNAEAAEGRARFQRMDEALGG